MVKIINLKEFEKYINKKSIVSSLVIEEVLGDFIRIVWRGKCSVEKLSR